jgi:hypothetical protein
MMIAGFLSLFMSNYFGQTVTSMAEELSEAAYGSLWYEQDMKFKKDFKTFLIYLDQEIVFEIKGVFRVDLEYFVIVRNVKIIGNLILTFNYCFRFVIPLILCMQF